MYVAWSFSCLLWTDEDLPCLTKPNWNRTGTTSSSPVTSDCCWVWGRCSALGRKPRFQRDGGKASSKIVYDLLQDRLMTWSDPTIDQCRCAWFEVCPEEVRRVMMKTMYISEMTTRLKLRWLGTGGVSPYGLEAMNKHRFGPKSSWRFDPPKIQLKWSWVCREKEIAQIIGYILELCSGSMEEWISAPCVGQRPGEASLLTWIGLCGFRCWSKIRNLGAEEFRGAV